MKLLVFSDIHNDVTALDRLMDIEADYYISAGDLATWARGLEKCASTLRRRGDRMYLLPGNHESADQIADFARRYEFTDFHGKTILADGYHIGGLGYSSPTPFNTPGEYTEQELQDRLKPFAGLQPLIMVCHCPPFGTPLDQVRRGLHAGSHSVKDFIETEQPDYFFCGHIHEAEGVSTALGRTKAINVGKRGYLLDLRPDA